MHDRQTEEKTVLQRSKERCTRSKIAGRPAQQRKRFIEQADSMRTDMQVSEQLRPNKTRKSVSAARSAVRTDDAGENGGMVQKPSQRFCRVCKPDDTACDSGAGVSGRLAKNADVLVGVHDEPAAEDGRQGEDSVDPDVLGVAAAPGDEVAQVAPVPAGVVGEAVGDFPGGRVCEVAAEEGCVFFAQVAEFVDVKAVVAFGEFLNVCLDENCAAVAEFLAHAEDRAEGYNAGGFVPLGRHERAHELPLRKAPRAVLKVRLPTAPR